MALCTGETCIEVQLNKKKKSNIVLSSESDGSSRHSASMGLSSGS